MGQPSRLLGSHWRRRMCMNISIPSIILYITESSRWDCMRWIKFSAKYSVSHSVGLCFAREKVYFLAPIWSLAMDGDGNALPRTPSIHSIVARTIIWNRKPTITSIFSVYVGLHLKIMFDGEVKVKMYPVFFLLAGCRLSLC